MAILHPEDAKNNKTTTVVTSPLHGTPPAPPLLVHLHGGGSGTLCGPVGGSAKTSEAKTDGITDTVLERRDSTNDGSSLSRREWKSSCVILREDEPPPCSLAHIPCLALRVGLRRISVCCPRGATILHLRPPL